MGRQAPLRPGGAQPFGGGGGTPVRPALPLDGHTPRRPSLPNTPGIITVAFSPVQGEVSEMKGSLEAICSSSSTIIHETSIYYMPSTRDIKQPLARVQILVSKGKS